MVVKYLDKLKQHHTFNDLVIMIKHVSINTSYLLIASYYVIHLFGHFFKKSTALDYNNCIRQQNILQSIN